MDAGSSPAQGTYNTALICYNKFMNKYIFDYDYIKFCAEKSNTLTELVVLLGYSKNNTNYRKALKQFLLDNSINLKQFNPQKRKKRNIEDYLVINGPSINTHFLKLKLIKLGYLENKCNICTLTNWLNKPISLHLDHINGVSNDNRIENLRLLCPNCHSQTDTYAGKNLKNKPRLKKNLSISKDSLIEEVKNSSITSVANKYSVSWQTIKNIVGDVQINRTKINWPSKEYILSYLENNSMEELARNLKVSSNAIRKHLDI